MSAAGPAPSPELFFDTITAYQRTAALKGALELDLFSAIGGNRETAETLAGRCGGSPRGVRILCDYLTSLGLLSTSYRTRTASPRRRALASAW